MPNYNQIIAQAAIRVGALKGTAAQIAASYVGDLSDMVSASFPLTTCRDRLRAVEEEMATVIAKNQDSILRGYLHDVTGDLASGDRIPTYSATGTSKKIIGEYGDVRDASSGLVLTPGLHEDEIRVLRANPDSMFKLDYYSYVIRPPRIYHTRPAVKIDVCVYDAVAQEAIIAAGGELLLPDLEGAYFYGLMAGLKNQDDTFRALADDFAGPYMAWLEALGAGKMRVEEEAA